MWSQIFVSGPFWEWEKKHFHCIIGASRQCQWSYLGPIKYLLKAYPSDHLKAPSIALHHMQWSVTFRVWPKWPDRTFQALLKLLHNNSGRAWKGGNILGQSTGNNFQKTFTGVMCAASLLPAFIENMQSCAWLPFWIKHTWKLDISWLSCW